MSVSIKFENISKQYRLGLVSTNTLSHDLNRWWKINIRGKEDPYLKIGEVNDRAHKGESEYVWALKDINFKVQQGDVLGIIGKNGAGKSTLLKILSNVTSPTTGSIMAKGRIASLLEVGTGFHPEMTGRENIFMNGAIMGMTKREITSKLDEIVDFSGIERYLDTPVKRYSSGMTVRLGFSIAAHLEPEILVVDEVLAVGDAEFQKKAIGKMQDVSKGEGRTVLFVSHNMGAVSRLCNTGVLLENGTISKMGNVNEVVDYYLTDNLASSSIYIASPEDLSLVKLLEARLLNKKGETADLYTFQDEIEIQIKIQNLTSERCLRLNVGLWDMMDNLIMIDRFEIEKTKEDLFIGKLDTSKLLPGRFRISIALDVYGYKTFEDIPSCISFEVVDTGSDILSFGNVGNGIISSFFSWNNKTRMKNSI